MTKTCDDAFAIIDAIRDDYSIRTRGVDAFVLAIVRSERQLRRIFTNLVFQASAFHRKDVGHLKAAMAERKQLYFRSFVPAVEELGGIPNAMLVDNFEHLRTRMIDITNYRNKIFHGQLTNSSLSTEELMSLESDIRTWCKNLAQGANTWFGYDGFAGDTSFFKSDRPEISSAVDTKIKSLEDYRNFLKQLEKLR